MTVASKRTRSRAHPTSRPLALVTLALAATTSATAAPGDVLFADDFEGGFWSWSTTRANLSAINDMTSGSGSSSLYLRGGSVTTTSVAVDARRPAIRIQAWVRSGDDQLSEDPECASQDPLLR